MKRQRDMFPLPTKAQRRALRWIAEHGDHLRPEQYDRFVALSDGRRIPSTPGLLLRMVANGWLAQGPNRSIGITVDGLKAI